MRGVTMSPVEKVRPAGVTGRRRREAIVKKNALPHSRGRALTYKLPHSFRKYAEK